LKGSSGGGGRPLTLGGHSSEWAVSAGQLWKGSSAGEKLSFEGGHLGVEGRLVVVEGVI
jgi:hypothetical protein